jgi:hypothetical protein
MAISLHMPRVRILMTMRRISPLASLEYILPHPRTLHSRHLSLVRVAMPNDHNHWTLLREFSHQHLLKSKPKRVYSNESFAGKWGKGGKCHNKFLSQDKG